MPQGTDPIKLQEWMERIDRFRNSSQSVARFCASEKCVAAFVLSLEKEDFDVE